MHRFAFSFVQITGGERRKIYVNAFLSCVSYMDFVGISA